MFFFFNYVRCDLSLGSSHAPEIRDTNLSISRSVIIASVPIPRTERGGSALSGEIGGKSVRDAGPATSPIHHRIESNRIFVFRDRLSFRAGGIKRAMIHRSRIG